MYNCNVNFYSAYIYVYSSYTNVYSCKTNFFNSTWVNCFTDMSFQVDPGSVLQSNGNIDYVTYWVLTGIKISIVY